jgi:hypothetical protein
VQSRASSLENLLVFVALSSMDRNHDFLDHKVFNRAWIVVLAIVALCIVLICARLALALV